MQSFIISTVTASIVSILLFNTMNIKPPSDIQYNCSNIDKNILLKSFSDCGKHNDIHQCKDIMIELLCDRNEYTNKQDSPSI